MVFNTDIIIVHNLGTSFIFIYFNYHTRYVAFIKALLYHSKGNICDKPVHEIEVLTN
jgi:hypothetical protein